MVKSKARLPDHLPGLITALEPAVIIAEKTRSGDLLDAAAAENVRIQVARLKSAKPMVQKSYADKKIDIVGAIYDLKTGKVTAV